LPSFAIAFHSRKKESSALTDKVSNIVYESQKPEVRCFEVNEWPLCSRGKLPSI
jgi:hypothetical protein